MKKAVEKLEALLELGGIRKDIVLLAISAALAVSIFKPFPLPFDAAWVAIILCRLPIIAEAFCGLVSSFDIKADVLVSMTLIAAVCIGEDFAAGEAMSEHPLGKAVAGCFRRDTQKEPAHADSFNMIPGRGISAVVSGRKILAGNLAMLNDEKIPLPPDAATRIKEFTDRGCSVIYVAADGVFVGFLALSDTARPESVRVIDDLHKLGVRPVLLTGDNAEAAHSVAIRLHIREVHSGCLLRTSSAT